MASEESRSNTGILEYLTALVAGGIGALGAAYNTIRLRFARDIRAAGAFGEINKTYLQDLDDLSSQFHKQEIDAKTWSQKTGERKTRHENDIVKELEERGHPVTGWDGHTKGMKMRYEMMSPASKRAVIINSAITAGIAFGGLMSFFNNTHMRHQLNRLEDKVSANHK